MERFSGRGSPALDVHMDQTLDLLTLTLASLGPRSFRFLAQRGALTEATARPMAYPDLIPEAARRALESGTARRDAEGELARAEARGLRVVGWDEPDYPERLRRLYDPPPVIWVRGQLVAGEGDRSVAVVGSRAASPQGTALARQVARDLAAAGVTVVSGLARGIDAAAHRGALEAGGRTVAVLGSGLDRVYPPENGPLGDAVAGSGVLVSEFPLGVGPRPEHFPRRNRVIAGWGLGVVVVEATERSGALVTARAALDEGREVMAVPGHPSHPGSAGTNALIRDGAVLIRNAADVAEALGLEPVAGVPPAEPDSLLAALPPGAPRSLEELTAASGASPGEVLARLARLELDSRVLRLPGALFVRS
jgi:DNA processing protein